MRKLFLALVVIGLLAIATGQALAVNIDYEALETVRKIYEGTTHTGWEYDAQLLFTDLTLADREKMGLPLTKANPDYDDKISEDPETNPSTIPMTEEDTTHIEPWSGALELDYVERDVPAMVEEQCKNKRLEYIRLLEAIPSEEINLKRIFKSTFTTEEDLIIVK